MINRTILYLTCTLYASRVYVCFMLWAFYLGRRVFDLGVCCVHVLGHPRRVATYEYVKLKVESLRKQCGVVVIHKEYTK